MILYPLVDRSNCSDIYFENNEVVLHKTTFK